MRKPLFAAILMALLALPAAADRNFGVKAGVLSVDNETNSATQAGFVYTADVWGMFGIEFDATTTVAKGDFSGIDYGMTQFGGYGVFMTPGPVYLKAKAGYAYSDLDFPGASSTGDLGYGVGFGFELFGVAMEIEYTQTKADDTHDAQYASFSIKF